MLVICNHVPYSEEVLRAMATYIMLSRLSPEGVKTLKSNPDRLSAVNHEVKALRAKVLSQYASLGEYDFITVFDAIHDQAQPRRVLKNIAAALRGGGTLLVVDVRASSLLQENLGHPLAPSMYAISTMHCMTVSLALGGDGLGTMWGEQKARQLLTEAGLIVP